MSKNPQKVLTSLSCKLSKEAFRAMTQKRYGIKSCRGAHTADDLKNYYEFHQLVTFYSDLQSEVCFSCDFNKLLEKANIP